MKVKYKIPIIEYEEGEIELTEIEEKYFNKGWKDVVITDIADRLHLPVVIPLTDGAFEFGYAMLEEIIC